uniref:DNA-directed RNA polymerase subunit n=1 Tax=Nitzschia sp. PL1-4 TaxID=2083272 RepID=A0A2Z5ZB13_9STRA|nr:RNA polymerase beta' subunit [Nitzschia sp. PL1-4]
MINSSKSFDFIKIKLASAAQILRWSHRKLPNGCFVGEVKNPKAFHRRTFKDIPGGLFCQRIFGPIKDYECSCGKYMSNRYRNIVCKKCGVEIISSNARRYRMGYIKLRFPVFHFWYLKSKPNIIALLLEIEDLEPTVRIPKGEEIIKEYKSKNFSLPILSYSEILNLWDDRVKQIGVSSIIYSFSENQSYIYGLHWNLQQYRKSRRMGYNTYPLQDINFLYKKFNEDSLLNYKYKKDKGSIGLTGSSLIYKELKALNTNFEIFKTRCFILVCTKILKKEDPFFSEFKWSKKWEYQRIYKIRAQAIKRIRILENFSSTGSHPSWITLTVLPIMSPELRPVTLLEGGVMIFSDLNEIYRLIITRNSRVDELAQGGIPRLFLRNERRGIQEAIDILIDNQNSTKIYRNTHDRPLSSLSDILRSKKGRLRQNLLGKRVNFSGRSVIVVEPTLKLTQCGLPYDMALELFKPFIIAELNKEFINLGKKNLFEKRKFFAKKKRLFYLDSNLFREDKSKILPLLLKVLSTHPVYLNRAPTLHRLGIQSFEPVLVEGKAIKLHPSVCSAYNADFDGDQMGVHIPLTFRARLESYNTMLAPFNLLSPSTGESIVTPSQDMVLGCSYLTVNNIKNLNGSNHYFSDIEDALKAYSQNKIEIHSTIWIRYKKEKLVSSDILKVIKLKDNTYIERYKNMQIRRDQSGKVLVQYLKTTVGRAILNYTIYKSLKIL